MSEALELVSRLRTGFGHDIHRFAVGPALKLGGVSIPHSHGLESHSDGDAVCHALMDALLAACGLPDIGVVFPPEGPALRGADSYLLLLNLYDALRRSGLDRVLSAQVTIIAEHPKISPYAAEIRERLASALKISPAQLAVSAGTNEKFDSIGRGEALMVFANVLLLIEPLSVTREPLPERLYSDAANARQQPPLPHARGGDDPLSGRRSQHSDLPVEASAAGPHDAQFNPEDEHLPERVKRFEKAVNTKLPPLPKAPHPQPGASLILYTDGGSRGNPGPAATGWVLFDDQGRVVHEQGSFLGSMTNNEAEYAALEEAFAWIRREVGTDIRLIIRMDSELIVKQLKGEYQVKAEHLRPTYLRLLNQLTEFHWANLEHVPRAQNARADALVNQALDSKLKAPSGG
ncbi:2-C-methyl-D-erythritol 2,4-cyclodiphosphate synthase [bacterium]|nr:2-C-methyl-D-erythritol 2,4-cyclodiphosphate synthase [bacterium]